MDKNSSMLQQSLLITMVFVTVLWLIKVSELWFSMPLGEWGVYPNKVSGLVGVVFAPLIHGSWQHLLSNTLPTIILGTMLLYGYPKSRWWTLAAVWLLSGIGVWIWGRESFHIGASGLSHGMFFFLLFMGIFRRDKRSVALLMIAFFMYGSMVMTIFPREPEVSFEYHLFGAVSGVISAIAFRNADPKPAIKRYDWEGDDEADIDDEDAYWIPPSVEITKESPKVSDQKY